MATVANAAEAGIAVVILPPCAPIRHADHGLQSGGHAGSIDRRRRACAASAMSLLQRADAHPDDRRRGSPGADQARLHGVRHADDADLPLGQVSRFWFRREPAASMAAIRAIPEGFDHAIAQQDRIATAFLREGDDALCHQHHGWVAAVDQSELPKRGLKCRCQGPDVVRPKRSCLCFQKRPNRHEEKPRKPGIGSLI